MILSLLCSKSNDELRPKSTRQPRRGERRSEINERRPLAGRLHASHLGAPVRSQEPSAAILGLRGGTASPPFPKSKRII